MPSYPFTSLDKRKETPAKLAPLQQEPFITGSSLHPAKEPKILVVDDSISVRLALRDGLIEQGYQVLTVENGKNAMKILQDTLPDLILSDVYMPEMDGLELCATLHGSPLYAHIPFVVMSTEKAHEGKGNFPCPAAANT
ncbi:MAG: response regulator [Pseudomonadota bacterium]